MELEQKIVSKVVSNVRELTRCWDAGLRSEAFVDPAYKSAFEFIVDYWRTSHMESSPTRSVILYEFPSLLIDDEVEELTEYLVTAMKRRYAANQAQDLMFKAAETVHEDPEATLATLWRDSYRASQVVAPRYDRVDMSQNLEERRLRYQGRLQNQGVGLPYGLDEVDDHTHGLLPGELAVVSAYSKCVDANTWVLTERQGLVQIGKIAPELPEGGSLDYRDTISTRGGSSSIVSLFHKGRGEGVEVVSEFSRVTSTREHRFLTSTSSGLEWRFASELQEGDHLLLDTSCEVTGGQHLDRDLSGLLGWVLSEGSLKNYPRIAITKLSGSLYTDSNRGRDYGDECRRDILSRLQRLYDEGDYEVRDDEFVLYKDLGRQLRVLTGWDREHSRDKFVPEIIMRADRESVREFLRCYFEGDGDFSTGLQVTSASRRLLEQIQTLLISHFGVFSRVLTQDVRLSSWTESREYYLLDILRGDNGRKFMEEVPALTTWTRKRQQKCLPTVRPPRGSYYGKVKYSRKWLHTILEKLRREVPWKERRNEVSEQNRRLSNITSIGDDYYFLEYGRPCQAGHASELSLATIRHFVQELSFYEEYIRGMTEWDALVECARKGYYGSTVESVSSQEGDFWDFTVEGTHSYTANGVMTHNTGKSFFLAHTAVQLRRRGYTPIFFTLEQSKEEMQDRIDAYFSGVSYDRLLHSQLRPQEMRSLLDAQDELASLGPLHIQRPPEGDRTVTEMIGRARQEGADYVLIDQLSWMDSEKKYTGDSATRLKYGDTIRELREEISNDVVGKIPCLLAVQQNRSSMEGQRRPDLWRIADSSEIERTVDVAFGLSRTPQMRVNNAMRLDIMGSRRSDEKSWLLQWHLRERSEISVIEEIVE